MLMCFHGLVVPLRSKQHHNDSFSRPRPEVAFAMPLVAFVLFLLAGCAGLTNQATPPPPQISVTMNAGTAQVVAGHSQDFSAQIQNDSKNQGVSWSLSGTACTAAARHTYECNHLR
jgi:hypothetical protein